MRRVRGRPRNRAEGHFRWVIVLHGNSDQWRLYTNNPNDPRLQLPAGIRWFGFQRERGNNGNPDAHDGYHWQMYVVFEEEQTEEQVRQMLALPRQNVFLEPAYGSHDDNVNYVTKNNTAVLRGQEEADMLGEPFYDEGYGNYMRFYGGRPPDAHQDAPPPSEAARGLNAPQQFQAAAQMACAGATMREIMTAFPGMAARYYNNLQKMSMMSQEPPEYRYITVKVYWGDTRTGKSRAAWREAKEMGIKLYKKIKGSDGQTIFWELYEDQKGILLEEFMGQRTLPLDYFLDCLDGQPFQLNTKGSSRHALFTHVWICTNIHPDDWYPNANPEQLAALRERIPDENIIHFTRQPRI
jgi:hypothetical protein